MYGVEWGEKVNNFYLSLSLEYDMKIQKEGVGRDTRYSVTASPKKRPMTDREKNLVDQLPDIQDINKELTKEQILNLGLAALEEDNDDFNSPVQKRRDEQFDSPLENATPQQRRSAAINEWDNL